MEGLKRELKMLERVELQILGALHKIKGARCNEGDCCQEMQDLSQINQN